MDTLKNLPASMPGLYDPSFSLKIVGVAGKYDRPQGPLSRIPEHTVGSNEYHRGPIEGSLTAGYFPASLWLLVERLHLLPAALALPPSLSFFAPKEDANYMSTSPATLFQHFKQGHDHPEPPFDAKAQKALEEELISLAKRYTADLAPAAEEKGLQLLKFLAFAKQYEVLDEDEAKTVLDKVAKSLAGGFDDRYGAIRSADGISLGEHKKSFAPGQGYLVTIDSLALLPLLFETDAKKAEQHAETLLKTLVRGNSVWELADLEEGEKLHIHGIKDGSGWSRGTAWGIYGFAHSALATGRQDFSDAAAKLAEGFFAPLPTDGVPYWDALTKTHRDATAATIAACGLLTLYKTTKDDATLAKAFKLIKNTLALCKTGRASARTGGIDMGKDGWETLLKGSSDGKKEFGTACADYYLLEFGNEALKLQSK